MSAKNARKPRGPRQPLVMTPDEANATLERADAAVKALRQLTSEANGTRGDLERTLRESRKEMVSALEEHLNGELADGIRQMEDRLQELMAIHKRDLIGSANE